MELVGVDDWVCFIDHDACWTTPVWYKQLKDATAAAPRACFTAVTNRIASRWQQASEGIALGDDIAKHRTVGKARLANRNLLDVTHTAGMGGVVMLVSKQAWYDAGPFKDGMFCVDHMFHLGLCAVHRPVYMIEGLYVYHFR